MVLPWQNCQKSVRVCADCLGACQMRVAAQEALAVIFTKAGEVAEHYFRTRTFVEAPSSLALYTQTYIDTKAHKAARVGDLMVEGAKQVTPYISLPLAIGARAVDFAWNFGSYALAGLAFRQEVVESLEEIRNLSADIRSIPPQDLIRGVYYLSAYTRGELRNDPLTAKTEVQRFGRPLPPDLLNVLLEFAVLAIRCPYEEDPFEAQRFAHQQGWRLITGRLAVSTKHRPAWCLLARMDSKVAVVSIRGTDVVKSRGGDLFTDCQKSSSQGVFVDGSGSVHHGMLASAHELATEVQPALDVLAAAGFQIVCTGHSMGGAVAAMLVHLLRNGPAGKRILHGTDLVQGIGYGVPAIMELSFSEELAPAFVSVVNSMDLVPRLGPGALKLLSADIRTSAQKCESDWNEDWKETLGRLHRLWEPKLRDGAPPLAPPLSCARLYAPSAEVDSDDDKSISSESSGDQDPVAINTFIRQAIEAGEESEEKELEFFIPGRVVWIHRVEAHLEAAVVPPWCPSLRRIIVDERMVDDHRGLQYHTALLSVQAHQALGANANLVRWQRFEDAGDCCPCCGSDFAWRATGRSIGHRFWAMTNCRACGLVVCRSCAGTRRVLPDQGIIEPARICDRCNWGGQCSDTKTAPAKALSESLSKLAA